MNIKNKLKGFFITSLAYVGTIINDEKNNSNSFNVEEFKDKSDNKLDAYKTDSEEEKANNGISYLAVKDSEFDPINQGYGSREEIETPPPVVGQFDPKKDLEDIADTYKLMTDPAELRECLDTMRNEKIDYLSQGLIKRLKESTRAE